MENFKSFGGRIEIPLERGFTAITGPNGSGKSNTGDAIQFVLGPKSSKSLRADQSTDLIFDGGAHRKPATCATVSLVFSNPVESNGRRRLGINDDEVTFTRSVRIGKGGKGISSYEFNGRPSTLTEIRRVLASAGVQAGGYNTVLQGDVTSLANMTPKARRKVLEEIAGVSAYDGEIQKADRRRSEAEQTMDLLRVLADEQEHRRSSLESERKEALRVQEIRQGLDRARIILAQTTHRTLLEDIEHEQDGLSAASEAISSAKTAMKALEAEQQHTRDEINRLNQAIQEVLGEDHQALTTRSRELVIAIDRAKDRVETLSQAAEDCDLEVARIVEEIDDVEHQLNEVEEGLKESRDKYEGAVSDLKRSTQDHAEAQASVEKGDRHVRELSKELSVLEDEVRTIEDVLGAAKGEFSATSAAHNLAIESLATAEEAEEDAQVEVTGIKHEIDEIKGESGGEEELSALRKQIHDLNLQEQSLSTSRDEHEGRLRNAQRRLYDAQQAAKQSGSGLPHSLQAVEAVLEASRTGDLEGVHGPLCDLVHPTDESHTQALLLAFGGRLAHVVVEDDSAAQACIQWLKKHNAGRATFLPLNKLKPVRAGRASMLLNKDGVVGLASTLVEVNQHFQLAVQHTLRDTVLVDSTSVGRELMGMVRMVSLDGTVFDAGGAMTGGSKQGGMRLNFRRAGRAASEVETCLAEVNRLRMAEETIIGAIERVREQRRDLHKRIHAASESDVKERRRLLEKELSNATRELERSSDITKKRAKELGVLENKLKDAEQSLKDTEAALEKAIEARDAASESLKQQTPAHLTARLREAETAKHAAEMEIEKQAARIEDHERRVTNLREGLERYQARREVMDEQQKERRQEATSLLDQRAEDEKQLEQVNEEIAQLSSDVRDLQNELNDANDTSRDQAVRSERVSDQIRRHEQRRSTCSRRIEEIRQELEEVIGEMNQDEIQPAEDEADLPTVDAATKSVNRLTREIDAIGPVNMHAIDQYDDAVQRLESFATDLTSLEEERESLLNLVSMLEEERVKRLTMVFDQIDENFREIYDLLSAGGSGELCLENPEDPFSGGLLMVARPAGKNKRTRLTALSGGEKSMAALAFIFSVQRYDPSPFYYLDEVDQNLDSDNAQRIALLCQKVSHQAQFIMVTLRKVSLQLADHHIGVTHAGDGVSRVLMDLDRTKAIELGEAALVEAKKLEATQKESLASSLPNPEEMPRVPEAPPELVSDVPKVALDGIRRRAADAGESDGDEYMEQDLGPIVERAQQNKEDLDPIPEDEEASLVNLEVTD
ncbi:MAG: chromosome segregation protein SMC [Euryarchaeota archaeon]|nr:chromosome segregation protein SMC [Euryarchaeota archaeon]